MFIKKITFMVMFFYGFFSVLTASQNEPKKKMHDAVRLGAFAFATAAAPLTIACAAKYLCTKSKNPRMVSVLQICGVGAVLLGADMSNSLTYKIKNGMSETAKKSTLTEVVGVTSQLAGISVGLFLLLAP